MKLSENTLQILKNFSTINDSILIKPGNIIQTVSPQDQIIAQAEIEETFTQEFAIYELSKFLGVLSLGITPDLEFNSKWVDITWVSPESKNNNGRTGRYGFTESAMIKCAPYKEPKLPEPIGTYKIEKINNVLKAGNVFQLPDLTFTGDGEKVYITCENVADKSSNIYKQELGETNKEFKICFKIENFKLIDDVYNVKITDRGIVEFSNISGKLKYWVASSK
jgi:hypothetical protein